MQKLRKIEKLKIAKLQIETESISGKALNLMPLRLRSSAR